MIYLELFWSFFQIGLFSIGGGYAAMPLIQNQVVDIHPWLTMTQFADETNKSRYQSLLPRSEREQEGNLYVLCKFLRGSVLYC